MSSDPTPTRPDTDHPAGRTTDPLGKPTDEITVTLRKLRRPGKRKHRIADLRIRLTHILRERLPELDDIQVAAEVDKKIAELSAEHPGVAKIAAEIAPRRRRRRRRTSVVPSRMQASFDSRG